MSNESISYLFHEKSGSLSLDTPLDELNKTGQDGHSNISTRDNTLNPKYIREVHHVFDTENGAYRYSVIIYTKSRIKNLTKEPKARWINLLEYKANHKLAKNEYRDLIFSTITTLTTNEPVIINTDYNIYGISNIDKIISERQIRITSNLWETLIDKSELERLDNERKEQLEKYAAKQQAKQEYHQAKSNLSPSVFPIIDRENTITKAIMAELDDYDIVRLSTINRIIEKYNAIIGIEFKWQEEIIRPCYYKHGIEQTSKEFDANSYFIYFNDRNIRGWISNKADRKNATKLLFRFAIALLYINGYLTDSEKKKRLTTDLVVYSAMIILQKYFIQGKESGNDWIKDMNLIKFIRKIEQFCEENNTIKNNTVKDALDGVKSDRNGCLFPDEWTEEEKRNWKEINNIEKKERKDKNGKHMFKKANDNQSRVGMKYKKQLNVELLMRILKLRKEGKTMEEIAAIMETNKMKISRLMRKIENNFEEFK